VAEVQAAVTALDAHGLLEDGDRLDGLTAHEAERHCSNLAFFESFASLDAAAWTCSGGFASRTCWCSAPAV
jgi:hypothetical protein